MFIMKFLIVLLVLLVFGVFGKSIPDESKKEQEIGEKYGNPLLEIDVTRNTLLDGTKTMNLTCSIVKKYKSIIKNVATIGWRRKAPEGDDFDLIMKLENGEFIWGEKIENSWEKFKNMKKHGGVYGQNEAASASVTIHVPRLPCENNGVFECFLAATTKSGKQKKWSSYYDFNDESLCPLNFLLDIDPVLLELLIAAVVLAFVFFVMLITRRHLKKTMQVADRSLEKEEVSADRYHSSERFALYGESNSPIKGSEILIKESGNLRRSGKYGSKHHVHKDGEGRMKRRVKKWRRKKRVRRHYSAKKTTARPPKMTHGPGFVED